MPTHKTKSPIVRFGPWFLLGAGILLAAAIVAMSLLGSGGDLNKSVARAKKLHDDFSSAFVSREINIEQTRIAELPQLVSPPDMLVPQLPRLTGEVAPYGYWPAVPKRPSEAVDTPDTPIGPVPTPDVKTLVVVAIKGIKAAADPARASIYVFWLPGAAGDKQEVPADAGYLVYRGEASTDGKAAKLTLLTPQLIRTASFVDTQAEDGKRYVYAVVQGSRADKIEGGAGKEGDITVSARVQCEPAMLTMDQGVTWTCDKPTRVPGQGDNWEVTAYLRRWMWMPGKAAGTGSWLRFSLTLKNLAADDPIGDEYLVSELAAGKIQRLKRVIECVFVAERVANEVFEKVDAKDALTALKIRTFNLATGLIWRSMLDADKLFFGTSAGGQKTIPMNEKLRPAQEVLPPAPTAESVKLSG